MYLLACFCLSQL